MTSLTVTSLDDFVAKSFDFLIIGGGLAGLTVASRLAENGKYTVGVIEAGPQLDAKDRDSVLIPAHYGALLGGRFDWAYETEPQEGCNGKRFMLSQGKVLGGSSLLNFTVWGRGSREDYDAWEALGNKGWGWDGLLPFFMKSETFHRPGEALSSQFDVSHDLKSLGDSGPIPVSFSTSYPQSHLYWHKTLHNLGFETSFAPTGGSNVGVMTTPSSIDPRTGTRSSSTLYHLAFPNLSILTGAVVDEIVLSRRNDGHEPIATGVRFTCGDKEHIVSASREVILSAGAIKSPQILELSGIGSPEILEKAGIPLRVDSPMVGENLQDHARVTVTFEIDSSIPYPRGFLTDPDLAAAAREQYSKDKTGPMTNVPYSFCFLPFSGTMSDTALQTLATKSEALTVWPPEKKAILSRRLTERARLGQIEYYLDLGPRNPYFTPEAGKRYGALTQILEYPFSRGSTHIRPSDGATPKKGEDAPVVDPGYYRGPHGELDLEAMSECLEFASKILTTAPLADIVEKIVYPSVETMASTDLRKQWIADTTMTTWHPMGSCAMGGIAGIRGGVVDDRLRVYGVKNLRVVDASIMPLQISAHLQPTVYAIGEKGADMILEDNGR